MCSARLYAEPSELSRAKPRSRAHLEVPQQFGVEADVRTDDRFGEVAWVIAPPIGASYESCRCGVPGTQRTWVAWRGAWHEGSLLSTEPADGGHPACVSDSHRRSADRSSGHRCAIRPPESSAASQLLPASPGRPAGLPIPRRRDRRSPRSKSAAGTPPRRAATSASAPKRPTRT